MASAEVCPLWGDWREIVKGIRGEEVKSSQDHPYGSKSHLGGR